MIADWLPAMIAASRHDDSDLVTNLTEMALSVGPEVHERQIKALVARPDASEYLADLTCPILLIAGSEDLWSPVDQHLEMLRLARHAKVEVVDGAGHFLPVEQPDEMTRLIVEWLAR